jgi:phenylacetate-coenzyme A ligase PaaK-like adenylate-forming protein
MQANIILAQIFISTKLIHLKLDFLYSAIFNISDQDQFNELAIELFHFQYENVNIYKKYCNLIKCDTSKVKHYHQIPFLPIVFFKNHFVSIEKPHEIVFESSGTGGFTSKHYIHDLYLYKKSFTTHFLNTYGDLQNTVILALLPGYLERQNSSLVYMVNKLIEATGNALSGFFLNNFEQLQDNINKAKDDNKRIILFGVSFAFYLAFEKKLNLSGVTVIETGGMKGKMKELTRKELHAFIYEKLNAQKVYSEYGMTELLSQAYLKENSLFTAPKWMQVLVRDTEDPFTILPNGKRGAINVIDLANANSCAFIATQDLGIAHNNHSFDVLGRFDHADIRGCNLMLSI